MYTIKNPLKIEFDEYLVDLKQCVELGQEFVSKEIAVELLNALRAARHVLAFLGLDDKDEVIFIDKAITNAEK